MRKIYLPDSYHTGGGTLLVDASPYCTYVIVDCIVHFVRGCNCIRLRIHNRLLHLFVVVCFSFCLGIGGVMLWSVRLCSGGV